MSLLTAARLLFALLFAVVTWLTVTPNPEDAEPGFAAMRWIAELLFGDALHGDKVAHFLAYGALGVSAAVARLAIAGRLLLTAVALALYGAALEGVQAVMGVRQPELLDALANASGAAAGVAGAMALFGRAARARA